MNDEEYDFSDWEVPKLTFEMKYTLMETYIDSHFDIEYIRGFGGVRLVTISWIDDKGEMHQSYGAKSMEDALDQVLEFFKNNV